MSACTGECCMYLGFDRGPDDWHGMNDGATIVDSFVEMSLEETIAYRDHFFPTATSRVHTSNEWHHYLCRHWNETTRECGIHDSKPEVCRDYPYDKVCDLCGFQEADDIIVAWIAIHAKPKKRKRGCRSDASRRAWWRANRR